MDITKTTVAAAFLIALVCGLFIGAAVFSEETTVEVPVETIVIEKVPVTQIVEKEVIVEDTAKIESLSDELSMLKSRYEQLSGDEYVKKDIAQEVAAIQKAIEEFNSDYKYKLIRSGFTLSEISIVKIIEADVEISEVSHSVDGKQRDYDKVDVEFQVKAQYKDEDGIEYKFWDVEVGYDLDSEGNEDVTVTATLV